MAFIVDHRLRQESTAEARSAVQWAENLGLEAEVIELKWDHTDQTRRKQQKILEEARHLRYAALAKKCREHRISWLLVGHHAGHWLPSHRPVCAYLSLDDEIEGFLMRGLRGSGLMGLAGMEEVRYVDQVDIARSPVFILRPFLSERRHDWRSNLNGNVSRCRQANHSRLLKRKLNGLDLRSLKYR